MTSETLLPWHEAAWEILDRARRAGRLPDALLFTGPSGVGKRHLVERLAHSLLCAGPNERGLGCDRCRECELLAAGTHPDYLKIGPDPEAKSDEIKVDAVRRLAESDALTAHRGGRKMIVLEPAQNLNVSAANSLLKTLEEPSSGTLICLVCEQPSRLAATIRSRCQELKIPVPPESDALEWLRGRTDSAEAAILLRLAHGAPLRALALADENRLPLREKAFSGFTEVGRGVLDPIAAAEAWSKDEPNILLDWLSSWVCDLLRLASGHPAPWLTNPDKVETLIGLARRIDSAAAHRYLRRLLDARSTEDRSVNRLLLYELLLVEWARIGARGAETERQRG